MAWKRFAGLIARQDENIGSLLGVGLAGQLVAVNDTAVSYGVPIAFFTTVLICFTSIPTIVGVVWCGLLRHMGVVCQTPK
jgi:hypothetical protein